MPALPHLITQALAASPILKYVLIAIGACIEGPFLFVISGVLLKLGAVQVAPLVLSLTLGDLMGDIGWYFVGRFVVRPQLHKREKFFGVSRDVIESTEQKFTKYSTRIFLISKATLGFGTSAATLPVLMTAGVLQIPFYRYLFLNLIGEMILLLWMIGAGYVFGTSLLLLPVNLRIAICIGIAALGISAFFIIGRVLKKKS
jgi:membrane protein DedA with SNARE-associated domain